MTTWLSLIFVLLILFVRGVMWLPVVTLICDVFLFVRYVMWLLVVTDILWYYFICPRCDVTTGSHTYLWYYFICQRCDVTTGDHKNICQMWLLVVTYICDHKCLVIVLRREVTYAYLIIIPPHNLDFQRLSEKRERYQGQSQHTINYMRCQCVK